MADPITAGLIIAGTAGSMYAQNQAANAQQEAYRVRSQQERVAAASRSVNRQQGLLSILSAQNARAGASGITTNSGSFMAVQKNTFRQFDQDERADALNTQYTQDYLQTQSSLARANANAGMAGSLLNAGSSLYNQRTPKIDN